MKRKEAGAPFVRNPLWDIFCSEWKWWLPGAIFSFFLASVLMTGWPGGLVPNIAYPYIYNGDGLSHSWLVQNAIEGWIFDNERNGYPFGSNFLDYPGSDSGNHIVLKAIGLLSGHYYSAINIYFLLGFSVIFAFSYGVSRVIGLVPAFAFSLAGVFAFSPFHFFRIGHLYYTFYFVVPLFFYFAFKLFFESREWVSNVFSAKGLLLFVLTFVCLASFGVYYALFGLIVLATAGILAAFRSGSLDPVKLLFLAFFAICLGVLANVAPNIKSKMDHGVNEEVAKRPTVDGEVYGFKLVQLLLPRHGHRVEPMAEVTRKYISSYPLVNENSFSALGVVGAVGFFALFCALLIGLVRKEVDDRLLLLSALVLVLFLFGTIGGFGAIFSGLVSSSIRGWNRLSIFISFGAGLAFFLVLQMFLRRAVDNRLIVLPLAALLMAFAVFDQTPPVCTACNEQRQREFEMDVNFIGQIERALPKGSAIYQLPYIPFPEAPFKPGKMEIYDLTIGFLNSRSLKWSGAGMKGRDGDLFYRALALEPIEKQVEVARNLGFAGLYIDRRGFDDHADALVGGVTAMLGEPPSIARQDGEVVFFRLQPVAGVDLKGLSVEQIMQKAGFDRLGSRYKASLAEGIDFTRRDWPDFIRSMKGLSGSEPWGRWSDANLAPEVRFDFSMPLPRRFTLVLDIRPFGPNVDKELAIRVGTRLFTTRVSAALKEIRVPVELDGETVDSIAFIPHTPVSPYELGMGQDFRKLGIGFVRLRFEE